MSRDERGSFDIGAMGAFLAVWIVGPAARWVWLVAAVIVAMHGIWTYRQ